MKQLKILSSMAVAAWLILSCEPQTLPVPTETSAPTQTSTVTFTVPALTATTSATPTPRPTQTATPIPSWVTNFAEPILKAIENRSPNFKDDFSNPYSGWESGIRNEVDPNAQATPPSPGSHFVGKRGYVDGEYFNMGESYSCVWSGTNPHVGSYYDFVAEFDVRVLSGENGDWGLDFRRNNQGLYGFGGFSNAVGFSKCPNNDSGCESLGVYNGNQLNSGKEWNHILLIVRGAKMAAYANGTPILFAEDKTFSDEFSKGKFALSVCTGSTPMEIRWDNLKIWNVHTLP